MPRVSEVEIRETVRREISSNGGANSLLIDEFVIGELGRIDIALISDRLIGYELKSDFDTLTRLPRQMEAFRKVFDHCTLVITTRHLAKAREMLCRGWGLAIVERAENDEFTYRQIRKPSATRGQSSLVQAELLWREELLRALDSLGASRGYRSATRSQLAERLAATASRDQLREIVTSSITARRDWRGEREQDEDVEMLQHANVSSGFLARRLRTQHR